MLNYSSYCLIVLQNRLDLEKTTKDSGKNFLLDKTITDSFFLTKFVEQNDWNTITEDFLLDTKFSDNKYLQLVNAYTKTSELKLFEIKNSGERKAVRINTLIYPEFQRNASKYRLVERVYSTSGKTKAFKEKHREKAKGQT